MGEPMMENASLPDRSNFANEPVENQSGLTRRQFLQTAAASGMGAVVFTGCGTTASHEFIIQSRTHLSEDTLTAFENWYASTCRGCDAGCGVIVRVIEGRAKKVEGNPDHPLNLGKLCARGQGGVQEEYHPDRIQGPLRRVGNRGSGNFVAISWDEALNELSGRLRQIRQSGRQSDVALITDSIRGHQAFLIDRFIRAYGGEWRTLDLMGEAPLREASRRVFGTSSLPEFDIANARFVLSFGADFLGSWLSQVHHSIEYGMFRQGDYRAGQFRPRQSSPRGYLVQAESHLTITGAAADEWLWVRPGLEGLLALSIGQAVIAGGQADAAGLSLVGGRSGLDAFAPDRTAQQLGLSADKIRDIARRLTSQRPSLVLGGGSAGSYTNGTQNLTAILALNALIGAVGRSGGILLNPEPAIKQLPEAPVTGLADWQRLTDRIRNGSVQAVLIKGANPVYSTPAALRFREALANAPYIVSFSSFRDETAEMADLILPSNLPLEEWGDDIPNPAPGFQVVSVQQPMVRPLYDTRSFWDVLLTVGSEIGGPMRDALPWNTHKDLIRENLRPLQGERRGSIREADFERFWVRLLQQGGWWDESQTGGTPTAPPAAPQLQIPPAQFAGSEQEYPFTLVVFPHNTLGAGEHAHLPWMQSTPDPITSATWQTWVELNPGVAQQMGLKEGDLVGVESPQGRIDVPVYIHPAAPPTVLAVPLGQGHTAFGRWAERRGANPMEILAPSADQATGAFAYGATRARLVKTGRRTEIPKYEGTFEAVQLEEVQILKITREA